jgi:hypothetical protein
MPKVYGIITCYYEQYKTDSVSSFYKMLRRVSKNSVLIIVNNSNLAPYKLSCSSDNIIEIQGMNNAWEFSAWDESINFIKQNYNLKKSDTFIFANDTFCKHRWFGKYQNILFTLAFIKLRLMPFSKRIVGERCSFSSTYNVFGEEINSWLSTYLFGMNYRVLEKTLPFVKVNKANSKDYFELSEKDILVKNSSPKFQQHINKWIFPEKGEHGWYKSKSGASSINPEILEMKLIAIFNEKHLSIAAKKNDIYLVDVYSSKLLNLKNRILFIKQKKVSK